MSLIREYARTLSQLTGNDFQAEVCSRLQAVILSFQSIPAKPQGDAGLDGISHNGEHGYCCYGPEPDEFKTAKDREKAVVEKFKSDLRKLFELAFDKRKLVRIENAEIATILPDGQTIKHIKLIVNWFESHRVLNPISTAAAQYGQISSCKYVDPGASVVVWGPKDLAGSYAVDESTILRSRQRVFLKEVQSAAEHVEIENPINFDTKMATLREIRPQHVFAIDRLTAQFLADWRMALAFERKIDETLPSLHQSLEGNRRRILQKVAQLMICSDTPWAELGRAGDIATEVLEPDFKTFGPILLGTISSGEVARLIGECPIGWQAPKRPNA
jgi:hypothetical protein